METGIQVSSLKPLLTTEAQVREACRKMAGLGCSVVQVQWVDPAVPVQAVAAALRGPTDTIVSPRLYPVPAAITRISYRFPSWNPYSV